MDWNLVILSMEDELEKIAVSLAGLSPETVLTSRQPEPMPTLGLDKARQILERANTKTAGSKKDTASKKYKKLRHDVYPVLKGMGAGGMIATLSRHHPSNMRKTVGALTGGTIGFVDHKIVEDIKNREKRERMEKKSNIMSPASLKAAASRVGKVKIKTGPTAGPTIKQQVPQFGRKGSLPSI